MLVVLVGCAAARAPSATPATLVRLADDAPADRVKAECGGEPDRFAPLEASVAYGECLHTVKQPTGSLARFTGPTLACELDAAYPWEAIHERGFTATARFATEPRSLGELWIEYSRSLGDGGDRTAFPTSWGERSTAGSRVAYRHADRGGVMGGRCDSKEVRDFAVTLTVDGRTLVLREEWTCHSVLARTWFSELRCSLPATP